MKIGYFADGPWSHRAFKKIVEDNSLSIQFIVPRKDTKDNTLRDFCREYDIDYIHPVNINSEEFYEKARTYECDIFLSMSFNQIFRKRIIELPRLHTINCHAGKLPMYRGRNILNWALINDEKEFGITVHFIDEGIDTGDIILQRTFPITDKDHYASLLDTAFVECANMAYEAIKKIQENDYVRKKQDEIHPTGFYCGRRGPGDEIIDWNQSSREVFNFVRAISEPGPKAQTTVNNGTIVKINKARLIDEAPDYKNTTGQLLSKTSAGFLVKTADSFIEISEIETNAKLRVGDKLGS